MFRDLNTREVQVLKRVPKRFNAANYQVMYVEKSNDRGDQNYTVAMIRMRDSANENERRIGVSKRNPVDPYVQEAGQLIAFRRAFQSDPVTV